MFHAKANELGRVGDGAVARSSVAHGEHAHLDGHPTEVADAFRDRMVGECAAKGRGNRNPRRGLIGQWRGVWV